MNKTVLAFATALALSSATDAFAQGSNERSVRGFIAVNGGMQVVSNDFNDVTTIREHAEDGRLTSGYTVEGGPALNIAGGATLWRQVAVGVGLTRLSRSTPAVVNGSIPHPFFFNQPRTVTSGVAGLNREELGINLRMSGVFPLGTRFQMMVFGGPTFFKVKQGVVTDFSYAEDYPYDQARFVRAETRSVSGSGIGFNAGADLAFFFTRRLGVGMVAQLSRATVDLPSASGGTQPVHAGGMLAGGGLRLRF